MSPDDFIRPHWLVKQFNLSSQTRNQKLNWNGLPFDWEYNVYYYPGGGCSSAADRGNVRYIVHNTALSPGDVCTDYWAETNPGGCQAFDGPGSPYFFGNDL